MVNRKENIGNNILDSILVVLYLLFVLSLCNNNSNHFSSNNKHEISSENIVSQSNAVIYTDIFLTDLQKTLISEIKYPVFVKHNSNMISENRKTDNQISNQKDSIAKTGNASIFIFHYYFYSTEKDDVPLLT